MSLARSLLNDGEAITVSRQRASSIVEVASDTRMIFLVHAERHYRAVVLLKTDQNNNNTY